MSYAKKHIQQANNQTRKSGLVCALPPRVRVPSTPSTHWSIDIWIVSFGKDENKHKKRPGLAHFFKKIRKMSNMRDASYDEEFEVSVNYINFMIISQRGWSMHPPHSWRKTRLFFQSLCGGKERYLAHSISQEKRAI